MEMAAWVRDLPQATKPSGMLTKPEGMKTEIRRQVLRFPGGKMTEGR